VALKVCCSRRGLWKRSIQLALLVIVVASTCLLVACGENGVMSRFMLKPDRIIVERRPEGDHAGGEDRFLTNPRSPTGRIMTEREIRRVCEAAKDQLVVLDEAYIHFSKTDGGMHLAKEYNNLMVLRTFSKV
jgi:Aminotransferase class I and II